MTDFKTQKLADERNQLKESLELALAACLDQLRTLRNVRNSSDASNSSRHSATAFESEEQALKLSLKGIISRLQDLQEALNAHRRALLLSVTPQVLPFLSVVAVLQLVQVSPSLRLASTLSGKLLIPHLDISPAESHDFDVFLDKVAVGSLRSLDLPAAQTLKVLALKSQELGALEKLVLPQSSCCRLGPGLIGIPALPSLQVLHVDGSGTSCNTALTSAGAAWIEALLKSLSRTLKELVLDAINPDLVLELIEAAMPLELQPNCMTLQRLSFRNSVLPDPVVAHICCALLSDREGSSIRSGPLAVHFEECELSEMAEQRLLQVLETSGVRSVVSINGGTTTTGTGCADTSWFNFNSHAQDDQLHSMKSLEETVAGGKIAREVLELRSALAQRDERISELERYLATTSEGSNLTELLAMGLVRLQEDKDSFSFEQHDLDSPEETSRLTSRFGFAFEEEPDQEGVASSEAYPAAENTTHELCLNSLD